MSNPEIKLFESGTTDPLLVVGPFEEEAGVPSDPFPFDLWNAPTDPAAETAQDIRVHVYERLAGELAWTQDREVTGNRWLEMRITGPLGNAGGFTTGWQPIGRYRPFKIPSLPAESGYQVELRRNIPGGVQAGAVELLLRVSIEGGSVAVSHGPLHAGLVGVSSGVGDRLRSFLVSGGTLSPSGTPDDDVHVSDLEWVHQGVLLVKLAHALTLDANDGAAAALTAGNAYWATLSLGSGPGVTVTKSLQDTAPLSIDDRPQVPEGEILIGYVHRDEDAEIDSGDLYGGAVLGSFTLQGAGLARSIGGGVALLEDRLVDRDFPQAASLPPSEAFIAVYLTPAGLPEVTTGDPTDPASLLLYTGETDSSTLLELTDRRPFLRRRPGLLSFRFDGVLVEDVPVYRYLFTDSDAVLSYPDACVLVLDDLGTSTTAGETVADVELWDGAGWVSLFTSSGTVDRRPRVAFDASLTAGRGVPEVRTIPKGSRLRATIKDIPTGGAAPSGAEVLLSFEVP